MDKALARSISRIGKEMAAAVESQRAEVTGIISGKAGTLGAYSPDYTIGLGVALSIMWESANGHPIGAGHKLSVGELMQWVRDIQKIDEQARKAAGETIQ